MLTRLTIKNFQAHKQLEVVFDPHVTTIVGPSDVGKSAIIRALTWLATNKPAGTEFIKEGTKGASALLEVDGRQILRRRTASINTYELDSQELKAFGNDVPPEVLQLLNLSEVNFQGQHDSPFWLSATAGEVSRQLNHIVDLGVIDTTLAALDRGLRASRSTAVVVEERVKSAKVRRAQLKDARTMDEQLSLVEEAVITAGEAQQRAEKLEALVTGVRRDTEAANHTRDMAEAIRKVVRAGESWEQADKRRGTLMILVQGAQALTRTAHQNVPDLSPLLQLQHDTRTAEARREILDGLVTKARQLTEEVGRGAPDIEPLMKLHQAMTIAQTKRDNLDRLLTDLIDGAGEVKTAEGEAEEAHREFEQKMGDTCPLCERKL